MTLVRPAMAMAVVVAQVSPVPAMGHRTRGIRGTVG